MSKIALAVATALLAGTTLATAANAEAVRVGFGFPLGSFVAHSNQGYSEAPSRRNVAPKYAPARKTYVAEQPVRIKAAPTYAAAPVATAPTIKTAKLEDRLPASTDTTTAADTSASGAKATTTVAKTADTTTSDGAATVASVQSDKDANPVCRRYSATVGGLVDVPCDQ